MRILRHLASVPEAVKGAVIAIGNFDGVHRGHQALIRRAQALAQAAGKPLAVMVFEPTPQDFFNPGMPPFRLTPFHAKARLVAQMGADALIALPFDAAMAHRTAPVFAAETLHRDLQATTVVVGEDFQFGAGRGGDAATLAVLGAQEGFAVEIVSDVMAGEGYPGEKISSTLIRTLLGRGAMADAAGFLGRSFAIEGTVEHGDARGRTLGFPTANVSLDGYLRPAFGIYAVRATLYADETPSGRYSGVANVGIRPMYLAAKPLLEAFLFDFAQDIYGRHIAVELVAFLRPEAKFPSVEALVAQMGEDCRKAKAILEGSAAGC